VVIEANASIVNIIFFMSQYYFTIRLKVPFSFFSM